MAASRTAAKTDLERGLTTAKRKLRTHFDTLANNAEIRIASLEEKVGQAFLTLNNFEDALYLGAIGVGWVFLLSAIVMEWKFKTYHIALQTNETKLERFKNTTARIQDDLDAKKIDLDNLKVEFSRANGRQLRISNAIFGSLTKLFVDQVKLQKVNSNLRSFIFRCFWGDEMRLQKLALETRINEIRRQLEVELGEINSSGKSPFLKITTLLMSLLLLLLFFCDCFHFLENFLVARKRTVLPHILFFPSFFFLSWPRTVCSLEFFFFMKKMTRLPKPFKLLGGIKMKFCSRSWVPLVRTMGNTQ